MNSGGGAHTTNNNTNNQPTNHNRVQTPQKKSKKGNMATTTTTTTTTTTRVWKNMYEWGSMCGCGAKHVGKPKQKANGKMSTASEELHKICKNIVLKEPTGKQMCTTQDMAVHFTTVKDLRYTDQTFMQELRCDDVTNLVLDLDDDCCPSLEDAEAKAQSFSDYVIKMCIDNLGMSKSTAAQQVALSSCVRPNKDKPGLYKGGIHAIINGFVCRYGTQGAYFLKKGWISECPTKTNGEQAFDMSMYSSRKLLRMVNNGKKKGDTTIQKPTTLEKTHWKHIPTCYDGEEQVDLSGEVPPPKTPAQIREEKAKKKAAIQKVQRPPQLDHSSPKFKKTKPRANPLLDEVQYVLHSIDPHGDREVAFIKVGNFMKFSCKFGTEQERYDMFEEWGFGGWKYGEDWEHYGHRPKPGWWEGEHKDLEYDLDYMRHLAKKTDWGAKRIAEFDNTSLLKDMLAIDSYDYSPQFGQDEVAVLVKQMMSSLLYDNKNRVVNEGLYRQDPETGIWHDCTKDEIVRFIRDDVRPFIERQLIPTIAKRATAIFDLKDDSAYKKEYVFLAGVTKVNPKTKAKTLVKEGLIHLVEKQLRFLHNAGPKAAVASMVETMSGFRGPPYMDEFWNNTHAKFTKFRPDLFPVKNGVIDLRSRVFRPAKYDEYVHYTTENDFKPADPKVKERVLDELWNIYASDDQVMTKLISVADCLVAGNQFRSFGIETGSGANGKGAIWGLVENTFGKLCGSLEPSAVQNVPKDPGAARSDIAMLHFCRIVGIAEPEPGESLKLSIIKKISGGDKMKARYLYKNTFEFKPQFTIWLQCNKLPPLQEIDGNENERGALDTRLLMLVNPFKFVPKSAAPSAEYRKDPTDVKEWFENDEEAGHAFLEICLSVDHHFVKHFKEQGINAIKSMADVKFPSGHELKYPEYYEEKLTAYKNATDTAAKYLQGRFKPMTPPGWKQGKATFDLHAISNDGAFRTDTEVYDHAFDKPVYRFKLAQEFDKYKETLAKGLTPVGKNSFKQRIRDLGFGITDVATNRDALDDVEYHQCKM
eukprot:SAG22_NODE_677_length_7962_cov_53.676078_1_plen_1038_part_00